MSLIRALNDLIPIQELLMELQLPKLRMRVFPVEF